MIIIFIILGCLTLLCLIFQKSKFLTLITFIFLWTLSWTKSQTDFNNYEIMYLQGEASDVGYYFLTYIFYNLGFDYYEFRLFFLGIGWSIYAWFIIKYSKKCAFTTIIYLWTVALFDMEQNRNFVAFSICLIGLTFILKNRSLKNQLRFATTILIASSFHITCAYFLIFLFLDKEIISKLSFTKIAIIIIVIASVLIYFFSKQISDKVENYNTGVSTLSKILITLLLLCNYLFIRFVRNRKISLKNIIQLTTSQYNLAIRDKEKIYLYNAGIFLLLPAAFMALSSLRIYRYMEILNLCYITDRLTSRSLTHRLFFNIITIIYSGSFLLVSYYMHLNSFLIVILAPFYDNDFYNNLF